LTECYTCHIEIFFNGDRTPSGKLKIFEKDLVEGKLHLHKCPNKKSRKNTRLKQFYGYLGIGKSA